MNTCTVVVVLSFVLLLYFSLGLIRISYAVYNLSIVPNINTLQDKFVSEFVAKSVQTTVTRPSENQITINTEILMNI